LKPFPLADTSFIVGLLNQSDSRHREIVSVYKKQDKILVIQSVLNEVIYHLEKQLGKQSTADFLKAITNHKQFLLIPLEDTDILRTAEILEQYLDSRIDFVDASIMAVAERMRSNIILTLDRRDFGIFRPVHISCFEILP
jgi:uncharacterized protein